MSRLGKLPVEIPNGVTANVTGAQVSVKGPKGELSFDAPACVRIKQEDNVLSVEMAENSKFAKAMYGTARARIKNMVQGVTEGFKTDLKLSLGFSHDVIYTPREGVKIATPKPTEITIEGADAQTVGQTAAEIREFRPPEPYKGKGVKYSNEYVRRKEGKKK